MSIGNRLVYLLLLSSFGDGLLLTALPVFLIYNNYSAEDAALIMLSRPLAISALGLLVVKYINTRKPLWSMRLAQSCRIGILLSLLIGMYFFGTVNGWMLALCFALIGGLEILFDSSVQGYIKQCISIAEISKLNNKMQSYQAIGNDIAGPMLAVILFTLAGNHIFFIPALLYLLSLCLIFKREKHIAKKTHESITGEQISAIRIIISNLTLFQLVLASMFISLAGGIFTIAYPFYILQELKYSSLSYGILLSLFGVGAFMVSIPVATAFGDVTVQLRLIISAIALVISTMMAYVSGGDDFIWFAIAQFVAGYALITWLSSEATYRQVCLDDEALMPVSSLSKVLDNAAFLTGVALSGMLSEYAGNRKLLLYVASSQLIATFFILMMKKRRFKHEPN
ncbi:MFS transporter [Pseudomonas syringae]|uniref:MFS transporter n=1 Tax=Pseudomonas syringae TaxID=317 RepID=UPI0011D0718F|nr:MFS transporter [Pseudomonas syringae]